MRIAIIVASGGALLWASSVQAQELKCPDIPPTSARSSDTSGNAEVSLLNRVISALRLGVDRKTTIDDVISRYPNASDLHLALARLGMLCPAIIHDPNLTMEQKREELAKLFADEVVRGPRTGGTAQPHSIPLPPASRGLSQADAAATAEELIALLIVGPTWDDLMQKLTVPFCDLEKIYFTVNAMRSSSEEPARLADYGRVTASATEVRTVVDYVADSSVMFQPGGFDLYNAVKQCQAKNVISPRDYVVEILIQFHDLQREVPGEVIVDQQSGLVKGILML